MKAGTLAGPSPPFYDIVGLPKKGEGDYCSGRERHFASRSRCPCPTARTAVGFMPAATSTSFANGSSVASHSDLLKWEWSTSISGTGNLGCKLSYTPCFEAGSTGFEIAAGGLARQFVHGDLRGGLSVLQGVSSRCVHFMHFNHAHLPPRALQKTA